VILPHAWNNGMMEYWKAEDPVFSGIGLCEEFPHLCILFTYFSREVLSIFHHHIFPEPIIPSFQYSSPTYLGGMSEAN
jgi:hypothetical protein